LSLSMTSMVSMIFAILPIIHKNQNNHTHLDQINNSLFGFLKQYLNLDNLDNLLTKFPIHIFVIWIIWSFGLVWHSLNFIHFACYISITLSKTHPFDH
jgi:hypothetical protein